MENFIKPQNSKLEFAFSALDFLVQDFINFLISKDLLKNTIIYILPDHLFMGKTDLIENKNERGLFLLTNASLDDISYESNKQICQIDLPVIILQGAKIKHNAKFLTEYIKGDKITYINKNKSLIASLNNAGIERDMVLNDKLYIKLNNFGSVRIDIGKTFKILDINNFSNDIIRLYFNKEMRLEMIKPEKFFILNPPYYFTIDFYIDNGEII